MIEYQSKEKGLITNNFKHLDYERGASMCVSKYICNENINYNYIESIILFDSLSKSNNKVYKPFNR